MHIVIDANQFSAYFMFCLCICDFLYNSIQSSGETKYVYILSLSVCLSVGSRPITLKKIKIISFSFLRAEYYGIVVGDVNTRIYTIKIIKKRDIRVQSI